MVGCCVSLPGGLDSMGESRGLCRGMVPCKKKKKREKEKKEGTKLKAQLKFFS